MERRGLSRNSSGYAEMIAEVFVETVRKSVEEAMCRGHDNEEITLSLMECLRYVYLHGPSPVRSIAWGLDISLSAASQLVERLVKKGFASRKENDEDRRLTEVSLTESGRDVVEEMRKRRSAWFASIVKAMSPAKRRAFLEGLEGFLRVALALEGNIDRACVRCGVQHTPGCVVSKVKSERSRNDEPGL